MSFEGYYQIIDCDGHYSEVDVYLYDYEGGPPTLTGQPCASWYEHIVDETNGFEPENIAQRIEVAPRQFQMCECCGHTRVIIPARYAPDPTDTRWIHRTRDEKTS